eukprot:5034803-Heterocapsa_arctica.AAC.1
MLEGDALSGALESAAWACMYDEKGLEWASYEDLSRLVEVARARGADPLLASVVLTICPCLDFDARLAAAEKAVRVAEDARPELLP